MTQVAIKELKDVIKRYNNQRNEHVDFFNSDRYKSQILEPVEENAKMVIELTNRIYSQHISEIEKAIKILERTKDSRRKRYMRMKYHG